MAPIFTLIAPRNVRSSTTCSRTAPGMHAATFCGSSMNCQTVAMGARTWNVSLMSIATLGPPGGLEGLAIVAVVVDVARGRAGDQHLEEPVGMRHEDGARALLAAERVHRGPRVAREHDRVPRDQSRPPDRARRAPARPEGRLRHRRAAARGGPRGAPPPARAGGAGTRPDSRNASVTCATRSAVTPG